MSPLTLNTASAATPETFSQLLAELDARPQPAVVWYSDQDRVELSGRVLANWTTKLIGLLREEYDLDDGAEVVVDSAPHWKASAMALAAAALGARVHLVTSGLRPGASAQTITGQTTGDDQTVKPQPPSPAAADVIITDRPLAWMQGQELGDAELAAVSPGLLDASFEEATGEELPAWVCDVSAEVRQHPDQLLFPLEELDIPASGDHADPKLLLQQWPDVALEQLIGTWAIGGVVVLFDGDPDGDAWERMLANEGIEA